MKKGWPVITGLTVYLGTFNLTVSSEMRIFYFFYLLIDLGEKIT